MKKSTSHSCPVITIDGPSGSGKGTISRMVADATCFSLLDSGALYRLTALATIQRKIDADLESAVADIAQHLDVHFNAIGKTTQVMLDGEEVTTAIRDEAVGMLASKIAAYPAVRLALLARQRDFLQAPGLVADGRDMGTVVFPDAELKIFLTASAQERACRRLQQLSEGDAINATKKDNKNAAELNKDEMYKKILVDIQARDQKDMNRAVSPLVPAADAIVLDSTDKSIDDVFNEVMAHLREHLPVLETNQC